MTKVERGTDLRRIQTLTAAFGAIGFVSYFLIDGFRSATAFTAGVLGSFGNLWMWNWLANSITPRALTNNPSGSGKLGPQAGLFMGRYLILIAAGYVIVRTLDVSPVAVILGLLVSTAAVLVSLVVEILSGLFRSTSTH